MLIAQDSEAWPLVEQAVDEFGDNLGVIDTRQQGLYIGNAVSRALPPRMCTFVPTISPFKRKLAPVVVTTAVMGVQVLDMAQGVGIRFWGDNDTGGRLEYAGCFENGQRHGPGIMLFVDSTSYEGEWTAGTPQGHGKEIYPDGSTYTGQFQHDTRHGLGAYAFADKSVYAGHWRDGVQDGMGLKILGSDMTVCTFER